VTLKDPLAIGLGALSCGMGLGGGTITVSVIAVRAVQRFDLSRFGEVLSDASLDVTVGLAAGIAVAAYFGWRRSAPLTNLWQRGVIGVLSVVGALLVSFLLAIPADYLLGLWGLALLAAASFAFGAAGSRWALHGAGLADDQEPDGS
jgi:hypothetical protein